MEAEELRLKRRLDGDWVWKEAGRFAVAAVRGWGMEVRSNSGERDGTAGGGVVRGLGRGEGRGAWRDVGWSWEVVVAAGRGWRAEGVRLRGIGEGRG